MHVGLEIVRPTTIGLDFNLLSSLFSPCPILSEVDFQAGCSPALTKPVPWLSALKCGGCLSGQDGALTLLCSGTEETGMCAGWRNGVQSERSGGARGMQGWCGPQPAEFCRMEERLLEEVMCRFRTIG